MSEKEALERLHQVLGDYHFNNIIFKKDIVTGIYYFILNSGIFDLRYESNNIDELIINVVSELNAQSRSYHELCSDLDSIDD